MQSIFFFTRVLLTKMLISNPILNPIDKNLLLKLQEVVQEENRAVEK